MLSDGAILLLAEDCFPYARAIRRKIHRNPELGNEEYRTTELIVNELRSFGFDIRTPLETGCIADLNLGFDTTIALRADIDALPIKEETDCDFASKKEGVMHACGHDIHTAVLLATAKILAENKEHINCNIRLIFQPDEEGNGGAKRLIECGAMQGVDMVFGLHVRPEIETGEIAVKYGKSYAASDMFEIKIRGKSCHGAEPKNGANPILAGTKIVEQINRFAPGGIDTETESVASVCVFQSGTAGNIIPQDAYIRGILRSFGEENRAKMRSKLKDAVLAAEGNGCTAELILHESYPGVVNSDKPTAIAQECAKELFGECTVLTEPTYTTEDFGYYLFEAEGSFFHIGVGSEYPLHSAKFEPDENAIKSGTAMFVKIISSL